MEKNSLIHSVIIVERIKCRMVINVTQAGNETEV